MDAIGRPGTTIGRLGRRTTVLLGVAAIVAACSTPGGGGQATNPPATQAAPSTAAESMSAPADVTLEVASDATLGSYVAGKDGLALYVFLPDTGTSGSECNGECAVNWPPLTGTAAAGTGVTGALGTITRDDGTAQVTLGGMPLYYFKGDAAAGDVKGQGLQSVWYLASPAGTAVGAEDGPKATQCAGPACY